MKRRSITVNSINLTKEKVKWKWFYCTCVRACMNEQHFSIQDQLPHSLRLMEWYLILKRNYNHKLITLYILTMPVQLMLYTNKYHRPIGWYGHRKTKATHTHTYSLIYYAINYVFNLEIGSVWIYLLILEFKNHPQNAHFCT